MKGRIKDKLILIGTATATFTINTFCYSFFDKLLWDEFNLGIFLLGLLYTPAIILSFFGGALFLVKKFCGQTGVALARFAVLLSALEFVVQGVGFYICGRKFGWLISELWGIYYDLVAVEALIIIGIILFVSLIVWYCLCRSAGCLHPTVNPAMRFGWAILLTVIVAYCAAFCLMMFSTGLLAQDITEYFAGKLLAGLILFLLLPGNCVVVSLLAKRLNRRFSFLTEGLERLAVFCATPLYLMCFHYSWQNIIWDEIYGIPLNMPQMWQVVQIVTWIWSGILLIQFIGYVIKSKKKI